jgi:hypothetical protein
MWTPLITNNKANIKDKIDQIAQEVENSAIDINEFGLLSGASGILTMNVSKLLI